MLFLCLYLIPDSRSPHQRKLNLPLNPLKKLHSSIDKSESKLYSKCAAPHQAADLRIPETPKSPFLSLKTPPSVLTKPSGTLYPEKKRTKPKVTTTPLTNVPQTAPPGTLPGYYLPPNPPARQKSQLQLLSQSHHSSQHSSQIHATSSTTPTSTASPHNILKEHRK